MVGNGFCNDETNNADCNYDGGDCCGQCLLSEHCEDCVCLGNIHSDEFTNRLVGDGVCNDETNIAECDYDGGYCCPNPNMVGDFFSNSKSRQQNTISLKIVGA